MRTGKETREVTSYFNGVDMICLCHSSALIYNLAMAANKRRLSSQQEKANSLDRAGRSPLHYAAQEPDLSLAKRLILEGCDVNLPDRHGWTPLHFAAQEKDLAFASLLLDSGALVDPQDSHGNTPLSTAVFNSRGNGELIKLLREHGADPYLKNNHGVSPLGLSRNIANYDVAQFFRDLPE
jgi:ankyrin repeat protein